MDPIVRPFRIEDYEAVAALSKRHDVGSPEYEDWKALFAGSPYDDCFQDVPAGWVLEAPGGRIVGTHTAIHAMYELDGQPLRALIGGAWAVDMEYRSHSLKVGAVVYSQKSVDLALNGSASKVAAQLMSLFRAQPVPSPGYDEHLWWITHYPSFAESLFRKKGWPLSQLGKYAAAPALWAEGHLHGRSVPRSKPCEVLSAFDERFDAFWETLRRGPGILRARRDAASLRWRFRVPLRRSAVRIVALSGADGLAGYAVLVRREKPALRVAQYQIMDLQSLDESAGNIAALLGGAIDVARREKVGYLEMVGFRKWKRDAALALRPIPYKLPVWQSFYKAHRPELAGRLKSEEAWDASPFDSD